MRVAILSPEFPPDIGGIETYAYEFTRELASRGHNITVFTRRHPQGEIKIPGVRIEPILRLRRHADEKALALFSADVWHAMNAAYAWLALTGRKTVVSVHGNDFLDPYIPVASVGLSSIPMVWRLSHKEPAWIKSFWLKRTVPLLSKAFPRVHHSIANSHYTENAFLEKYPACRGRSSVGLVGVGRHFFDVIRLPREDDIFRLVTVCRLSEPRKNVDAVLRTLAVLKDSHRFRYTVVGDGRDRPRLEALALDMGLHDRVRYAGFVSRKELMGVYAQSDLMVLASSINPGSHEGFGIVYLEAAASGVPSLAARLGGAAEAVEEGVSGMFVDNPTVEGISKALVTFLDGRVQFDPEACRAFAKNFSWAQVVDHALQHYS